MALTRANVESVLIRRVGKLLAAADLDGTTANGSNADLNDPIGVAIRKVGQAVDDLTAVDDDDVARIAADDYDQFLDLAELRALETIQSSLDDVDLQVGQRSEKLGQLAEQVRKRAERLRERIEREYGVGLGTLQAGVIALGFLQQNDTEE